MGEEVQWCFSSLDRNIEVSVQFLTEDQCIQTVVPLCRGESKSSLSAGEGGAMSDGCVRLIFDNSKSSWYSCSVSYEVTVEKKQESSVAEERDALSIWFLCLTQLLTCC